MPLEIIITFVFASTMLALAPGPDNIFVLTQAAIGGRLAGILITLGLCTGLIVHTAAVALGVAAIFQQSELAFTLLKLCGAAYLLYLAWGAFRAGKSQINLTNGERLNGKQLYLRGVIMNITNPKVSIFFLAFLPQFASVERGSLAVQIIALGFIFLLVALVVFSLIAILAGTLGGVMSRSARAQIILNKIAGTVFAGLALKLALTER